MLARLLTVLTAALVWHLLRRLLPRPKGALTGSCSGHRIQRHPHTFARTPSFGCNTVRGAARYELQAFHQQELHRERHRVGERPDQGAARHGSADAPRVEPGYSWHARVRAFVGGNATAWSDKFGFNLRSPSPPASLSTGAVNPRPGLVRWTPVSGATAYEVSFITDPTTGTSKKVKSATTAADLREYDSFHNDPTSSTTASPPSRARSGGGSGPSARSSGLR